MTSRREYLLGTAAICAIVASATAVSAGGFAVRQQSVSSQGASYAGAAAGGDLSSMFWNPAAATVKPGPGLNSESHYSLMIPHAEINVTSSSNPAFLGAPFSTGTSSGDITSLALGSASYYSYQLSNFDKNLYLAFSLNSPFGLKTKPDNDLYAGSVIGRGSKLLTFNLAPTLGYKLSDTLSIGVGAQLQYAKAHFSFATGAPIGADTKFEGSGLAAGWTAGILWQPTSGTSIGLGYRSGITQELDGAYINTQPVVPALGVLSIAAKAKLELPDTVTLSLRQSLTQSFRLLGTVEWTNWGVLNELRVTADGSSPVIFAPVPAPRAPFAGQTLANLPVGWTDGWYFALGGEYDWNQRLTLRAGGAYEITPIDSPTKRLVGIPDNDRIWASLGATYKWSETMSFDVAYSHLFIKDSTFDRTSLSGVRMTGGIEASMDIISVSMKSKW
jgi:long-chain fatty acid transport protein